MTNKPQALDEQMIADMARAMEPVAWERLGTDRDRLKYEYARSTTLGYARAAHSLMAAKVAELEEALKVARMRLKMRNVFVPPVIDAALAPHPEGTDR